MTMPSYDETRVIINEAILNKVIDVRVHKTLLRDCEYISKNTNIPVEHLFGVVPIATGVGFTPLDIEWVKDFARLRSTVKGILYIGNNAVRLRNIAGLLLRNFYEVGVYSVEQLCTKYENVRYDLQSTIIVEIDDTSFDKSTICSTYSSDGLRVNARVSAQGVFNTFIRDCMFKKYFLILSTQSVTLLQRSLEPEQYERIMCEFYIVT